MAGNRQARHRHTQGQVTAMDNPPIREIGTVTDIYGPLSVAVHRGYVGIGDHWLTLDQAEKFAVLFVNACWLAGGYATHGGNQCRDALSAQAAGGGDA